ncbi:helix-turn-helix domain-containing protein [Arthrobacter sp. StoSoilA2]|uniref:sigma-54-dependent Fis family transcriptional regulator n=1 Tax=Arthrobacter sp. StoSoilA2 TaxID=2830990 RepID=UPI001CC3769B|nr:helix-turn-helix domain-containing protein [Arthrobacter sp. StoSoilA2]
MDPNAQLRPEITTSWRRSRLSGVAPDGTDVPFSPLTEGANRLLVTAATPVIDWLADQLPAGTAVILADPEARILDRRASGNMYSRHLDEALCVPGSSYSEEHIGTNGIGSVIETSNPVIVTGSEHYRENLQNFTCAGAPLHHPLRRNLTGVLSVSCNSLDRHGLMVPLLQSAAREIKSRMYAESSLRERMLLEEFLGASRRTSAAVVSLNEDFLIKNTAAATLLDPTDHALLWDWATASMAQRTEIRSEVTLRSGAVLQAWGRMVGERPGGAAGVVVELRAAGSGPPHRKPAPPSSDPELPGRSATWRRTLADMESAARSGRDVLLTGESGTGKTRLATRIAGGNAVIFEAALAAVEQDWAMQIRSKLDGPEPVIIRQLEVLPPTHVALLAALLGSPHTARVVATANVADLSGQAARLLDHFGVRVELPPLRQRPEDIPDIATALLRGDGGPSPRVQAAALRALGNHTWPGNIRELGAVLASARLRAGGADIGDSHLPAEYRRAAGNPLPSLQRSERETIVAALDDCRGNKLAAADLLGIARSTLYRKMRSLRIDDQRWA